MLMLHPMIVHFPITLLFLEFFLFVLWKIKKHVSYRDFAVLSFRLALVFLPFSVVSGYIQTSGIGNMSGEVSRHFWFAVVLLVSCVFKFISEKIKPFSWTLPKLSFIWSALNVVLVSVTAYFGGWIVYRS